MNILGDTSSDIYPWAIYILAKGDVPADVAPYSQGMEKALLKNDLSFL